MSLKYFLAVFVSIVRSISYAILPYWLNVPVVQLKVANNKFKRRKTTTTDIGDVYRYLDSLNRAHFCQKSRTNQNVLQRDHTK